MSESADAGRPEPAPLDLLLRWPGKVLEEIVLAPWTVARVRGALTELPERIEVLSSSLDETITMLGSVLPGVDERLEALAGNVSRLDTAVTSLAEDLAGFRASLDALLPELSSVVNGMDVRFRHVESMMGDLGDGVLGVLGSIPGVRRSLKPH